MAHGIARTLVIPWGIEKNTYEFQMKKRNPVLHIIHVGHLTPVKDQVTLVKAFALVAKRQPSELRIFGEDFLRGAIQKLCKELGIEKKVQFLDIIPYEQMPEQYAWANMMLHTSSAEGQSMALTEAAACGVLLAGTNVGLLHDLGEECGITVEPGDFNGLATKVLSVLDDHESWNKKINNARRWAETHDLSWTISELISHLQPLLK